MSLALSKPIDQVMYFLALFSKGFKKKGLGRCYAKYTFDESYKVSFYEKEFYFFSETWRQSYHRSTSKYIPTHFSAWMNEIDYFYTNGCINSYLHFSETCVRALCSKIESKHPDFSSTLWKKVNQSQDKLEKLRQQALLKQERLRIEELSQVDISAPLGYLTSLFESKVLDLVRTNLTTDYNRDIILPNDEDYSTSVLSYLHSSVTRHLRRIWKKSGVIKTTPAEVISEFSRLFNLSEQEVLAQLINSECEESKILALHACKKDDPIVAIAFLDEDPEVRTCALFKQQGKFEDTKVVIKSY